MLISETILGFRLQIHVQVFHSTQFGLSDLSRVVFIWWKPKAELDIPSDCGFLLLHYNQTWDFLSYRALMSKAI